MAMGRVFKRREFVQRASHCRSRRGRSKAEKVACFPEASAEVLHCVHELNNPVGPREIPWLNFSTGAYSGTTQLLLEMNRSPDGSSARNVLGSSASGVTRRAFLKSLGRSAVTAAALGATGMARGVTPEDTSEKVQGPGAVPVTLTINGHSTTLQLEPRITLLDAIRTHAGLTGTKESCDRATCGACTVLLNGTPVYACSILAIEAQGAEITTIEGIARDNRLTGLQQAFVDHDGLQCGYCSPGMVLTLTALLRKNPHPTEAEVRRACSGNLCRCGSYPRIFTAALAASGQSTTAKLKVLHSHDHALA